VDAKPVLAALPQAPATAPHVGVGLNEPFNRPGWGSSQSLVRLALRPPMLIAAGLLLAALLLFLLPPLIQGDSADSAAPAATSGSSTDAPAPAAGVASQALPAAASASGAILPPGQGGMSGVVVETVQPLPLPGAPAATNNGKAP
jgi:hypothetical protein